ncbi:MAG: CvpA family protein [Burkholderiales bacterium]
MTWVDYAVLAVLLLSIGWGLWRGLVREVMSLASWIIAFLAANLFAARLAELLPRSIARGEYRSLVAFIVIFVVVLIITTLGSIWLAKAVRAAGLGSLDRTLGAFFGLLRALLIMVAAALVAGFTRLPATPAWKDSASGSQLAAAAIALKPWLPPALAERMKYN